MASQCIATPDDKTGLTVLALINPLEYVRINQGVHVGRTGPHFLPGIRLSDWLKQQKK